MGLKAPSIIVFMISIILAVVVVIARVFNAEIPLLTDPSYQFYGLSLAYVLLVLGNLARGL